MARRKGGRKHKGGRGKALIAGPFQHVFGGRSKGGKRSTRGRRR